jgi:hypothetical protein
MRLALYVKTWKRSNIEPDMPNLGLRWWRVPMDRNRFGIDILHPWGRLDLIFTTDPVRYEKALGMWAGRRIF